MIVAARLHIHMLLCVLFFVGGGFFTIRLLPNQDSALQQKARKLCKDIQRVNIEDKEMFIAFYGASMTFSNINPDEFDKKLSDLYAGPCISFNFGLPAARLNETLFSVRNSLHLMQSRGIKLPQFVFIDLTQGYSPEFVSRRQRDIDCHDIAETMNIARFIWSDLHARRAEFEAPLDLTIEFIDQFRPHLDLMLRHYMPIGEGRGRMLSLGRRMLSSGEGSSVVEGEGGFVSCRGYDPYTEEEVLKSRDWYKYYGEIYEEHLRELREKKVDFALAERHAESGLADFLKELERLGVKPVFFIPPTIFETSFAYGLQQAGIIPNLLAFNDPAQYPGYYDPSHRFNAGHLDNETSARFSKDLASRFHAEILLRDPDICLTAE